MDECWYCLRCWNQTTKNSGLCWLQCRKCKNTKREYSIYLFVRKCKQSVIYMSFLPIKLLNESMVFFPLLNLTVSNCIAIKL